MEPLDGDWSPFNEYAAYDNLAPCMRDCDGDYYWNGCDRSACWCNKGNLDLRMSSMKECASESCTFANMNTQTDLDMLSAIQVQYCADKGFSPEGMTLPSTNAATATTSDSAGASATTTRRQPIDTLTRSRPDQGAGPTATSDGNASSSNNSSSSFGTAAKAGVGVGAAFCVLLAILIIVLLRRRRQPPLYIPPPNPMANNNFPNNGPLQPPQMPPTPYSGNTAFSPPPLQQPVPIHPPQKGYTAGDVSPIEEKAVPVVTVKRKEVRNERPATPPSPAVVATHEPLRSGPKEVDGDVPPPRHEVSNDRQITNTASTRGMELDSQPPLNQYPGQNQYHQSAQGQWGYNHPQAYEVEGGQHHWGQRQEADGRQNQWRQELPAGQPAPGQGYGGQQQRGYPGAYEIGPGR